MAKMEEEVRKITTDGLLWGAAKLVPLAYGIKKLQISSVVEDDKVSVDWLQEQIEALEDYVRVNETILLQTNFFIFRYKVWTSQLSTKSKLRCNINFIHKIYIFYHSQ